MDAIPFIILLLLIILALPIGFAIWMITAVSRARSRTDELSKKLDWLELELQRLKKVQSTPAANENKTAATAPIPQSQPSTEKVETPTVPLAPMVPIQETPPPTIEPAVENIVPPLIPSLPPPEPVVETAKISESSEPVSPPPVPEKASFEMRLGTFWLVRIGIVMLLTGLAFFANYAYHHIIGKLGPAGKISLLYLAGGLLLAAGAWWQRRNVKESLKNFAQVLFAGGLAAVYFTTYAAYHIPPLRVIQSALLDGTLLLAWAGFIMWIADRRKSEITAVFAVGLAFYSSVITRVGEFTLYSNLILTIAAVAFLVRNRWAGLSFASLGTSYAGYTFWRFLHDDGWRWATPDENLWLGAGFLASYWLVFTAATFLSKSEKFSGPSRAAFLTLNNGAFFSLFLLTMLQVHSGGFWKFSLGYGTTLLVLAVLAQKFLAAEPFAKNSYLTQGLLLVTLGFISKFSGLQLSLVLGAESVVLFILGSQRQSITLKFFAYSAALLATGWCVGNLKHFDSQSLWTGAALGGFMIANAFCAHWRNRENEVPLRLEPSVFVAIAFVNWITTTWFNTSEANLPLVLAVEAVALTFSIYILRLREITYFGQFFLIFAQLAWLLHFWNLTPPWWNPLLIIGITLGLSHWWQHQKRLEVSREIFICYSALFAVASVAISIAWLQPLVSAPNWLALSSLLAIAVTIYGVATRAWPLAICGQIFLLASGWGFLHEFLETKPIWYFPLAPIVTFLILSFGTVGWFTRKPDAKPEVRGTLLQTALVYRWIALAMSLMWIGQYVSERERVWVFMLAAAGVFALAIWRRNREALLATTIYAVASLVMLWLGEGLQMDIYWPNVLALIALFVFQQILRRASANFVIDDKVHGVVVFISGISLWRFLSCWTATFTSGFFVTMSWAVFAVLVFTAGILLRERFYRWFGLFVLAASVGRVIIVDVWKQETIYRVLTFMALGIALLIVGFVYNKYQEKIRQWL